MLRVDLDGREVSASVRDMAHATWDVASADGPLSGARALLGSEVHRDYRAAREQDVPGFCGEVTVSGEERVDEYVLRLRGRVDGLITGPGAELRVEEVKSVALARREIDALAPGDLPEAALQLRIYALLLAREHPQARIRARLIVVSILERGMREIDVTLRPKRTEQALVRRARRLIRTAARRRRRAQRADATALRFPYHPARPHQLEMAAFVRDGLEAGHPTLVEAPTGIGKTVAALLPALRHAQRHAALLYVVTSKRTQRARVAETFEDIVAAAGEPASGLRALTLRARTDMCPRDTALCGPQQCTYRANLRQQQPREAALTALLAGEAHIQPEAVCDVALRHQLCPHLLALVLCARVDVAIGDYNHVYRPSLPPGRFPGELLPRPVVVVVDEAHNLFDRARAYDSPFLARRAVVALHTRHRRVRATPPPEPTLFTFAQTETMRATRSLDARIAEHLDAVLARLDQTLAGAADGGPAFADGCRAADGDARAWAPLAKRGARLLLPYMQRLHARGLASVEDPLVGVLHEVERIHDLMARDDPALVPYAACDDGAPRGSGVGICCVDPAPRLAARHGDVLGTVAMSATLTPLSHYEAVLGFDRLEPRCVAYGSPFPVEQRCVAVVPTVSTTWRARRRHYARIARTIERGTAVRPGHYVAYFPSFAFLEAVRSRLSLPADAVLVQTPRMPDDAREEVLARLAADPEPLLLLAVSGGVFAEGIDLPGEALIGAFVVGPALPRVGFERAAMAQHFEQAGGRGFARAMLHPGMQRVVQAAGRVHRTPEDTGVIVLLGRRFAQAPFTDCLPEHWFRYGAEESVTEDPVARLSAFWHGTS